MNEQSDPPFALPLTALGVHVVHFRYRNWRGASAIRRVVIKGVQHGRSEHHKEPQWLLHALDLDKGEDRLFAMKDISDLGHG